MNVRKLGYFKRKWESGAMEEAKLVCKEWGSAQGLTCGKILIINHQGFPYLVLLIMLQLELATPSIILELKEVQNIMSPLKHDKRMLLFLCKSNKHFKAKPNAG